jgi:15-cis-phytoene synthase
LNQQELVSYCKMTIQKGSKSFALASFFFSRRQRRGAWLLYSWCRYADDLIDKAKDKSEALQRLNALEEKTKLCWQKGAANLDAPELIGLAVVAEEFQVPQKYALDLLRGMRMDIEDKKYETIEDLLEYCYCVAGTVGLMMCHIMGLSRETALENAVHLGNAMQLTNISRDVLEDLRLGRIYFPRQWLQQLDVSEESFSTCREAWAQLSQKLLAEAETHYQSGWQGLDALPFRAAWAVAVAAKVYARIGAKVAARGMQAWDKRCYVTLLEKSWISVFVTVHISLRMLPRLLNPWKAQPINVIWSRS